MQKLWGDIPPILLCDARGDHKLWVWPKIRSGPQLIVRRVRIRIGVIVVRNSVRFWLATGRVYRLWAGEILNKTQVMRQCDNDNGE